MSNALTAARKAGALSAANIEKLRAAGYNAGGVAPGESRGKQYANFNGNTGALTVGRAATPIPPDQKFVIPYQMIRQGLIYWKDKKPEAGSEVIVTAFEDFPEVPDGRPMAGTLPKPREREGWAETYFLDMAALDGPLNGLQFEFARSSQAFQTFWGDIAVAVADRFESTNGQSAFLNPVITIEVGSYPNKQYDRTVYTLHAHFVGWTDGKTVIGNDAPEALESSPEDSDEDLGDVLD